MISLSTAWIPERGWPLEQVFDTLAVFDPASLELNYRVHPLDIAATQQQLRDKMTGMYRRRGYAPDKVASAILGAIESNTAVLPVTPEAHAWYRIYRFTPRLSRLMARAKLF